MALKNMTYSLYSKIALWLVLNLVLLAVLGFGIGWYVLLGNGLVPAHFFSSNIENSFRLVSVNLQYRSVFTWQKLLKQYDRGEALRFHLRSLETGVLYDDCIPEKVIQAAMAIPKSSFTLCPDPDMQLWDSLRGGFFDTQQRNMEAGLPPSRPPSSCARIPRRGIGTAACCTSRTRTINSITCFWRWRRIPFTATGCFSNSGASSW